MNALPPDDEASDDELMAQITSLSCWALHLCLQPKFPRPQHMIGEESRGTLCLEETQVTVVGSGLLDASWNRESSKMFQGSLNGLYGPLVEC